MFSNCLILCLEEVELSQTESNTDNPEILQILTLSEIKNEKINLIEDKPNFVTSKKQKSSSKK